MEKFALEIMAGLDPRTGESIDKPFQIEAVFGKRQH
jgi:hypothetical protein